VFQFGYVSVEVAKLGDTSRNIPQHFLGLLHNGSVMRIGANEEEKFVKAN
jgi:hypothetical protein